MSNYISECLLLNEKSLVRVIKYHLGLYVCTYEDFLAPNTICEIFCDQFQHADKP